MLGLNVLVCSVVFYIAYYTSHYHLLWGKGSKLHKWTTSSPCRAGGVFFSGVVWAFTEDEELRILNQHGSDTTPLIWFQQPLWFWWPSERAQTKAFVQRYTTFCCQSYHLFLEDFFCVFQFTVHIYWAHHSGICNRLSSIYLDVKIVLAKCDLNDLLLTSSRVCRQDAGRIRVKSKKLTKDRINVSSVWAKITLTFDWL